MPHPMMSNLKAGVHGFAPVWCIMPGLSVVVAGATLPVCRPPVWCVFICTASTTTVTGLVDTEGHS